MKPLAGLRVLVTRPAHQAETLCQLIAERGGHSLRQPLLAIEPPADADAALARLRQAPAADAVIFTSVNAVQQAWTLWPELVLAQPVLAIGAATARALLELPVRQRPARILTPAAGFTSEALLSLPQMQQLQEQTVALIGGEGGRELLPQTLVARGARVHKVGVYRREPLAVAGARMAALLAEADAAVVTSGEGLGHLVRLVPAGMDAQLRNLQLVVPSRRVLKMALEFGFEHRPLLPEKMSDADIVDTLQRWASARR